jgi:hypothetical protein
MILFKKKVVEKKWELLVGITNSSDLIWYKVEGGGINHLHLQP